MDGVGQFAGSAVGMLFTSVATLALLRLMGPGLGVLLLLWGAILPEERFLHERFGPA